MLPITTKLTKLLNIKTPILGAPMFFGTTPDLAAKVTAAGGFGFIGAGFDPLDQLKKNIQEIRSALNLPKGVPVPTGFGFVGWILDMTESSDEPRLTACLDEMPVAVWFAFGPNLGKYIAQVRAHDAKREHKTVVFVIVHTVEEALRAANEWKVDAIVVQGVEAGGHANPASPPTFEFAQSVLKAIPDGPLIIAAGGISTGKQIASYLTLGVPGVALGTRFLFTNECAYTDEMKAVLVEAGPNATARSHAFDETHNVPIKLNWPEGIDGRAVANKIYTDSKKGLSVDERKKMVETAQAKGDKDYLLIWAGAGIGDVNEIKSTTDVMHELHSETVAALKSASHLVG